MFSRTRYGLTPVHAACYAGHLEILLQLVKSGGDLRLRDRALGWNAIQWTEQCLNLKAKMSILDYIKRQNNTHVRLVTDPLAVDCLLQEQIIRTPPRCFPFVGSPRIKSASPVEININYGFGVVFTCCSLSSKYTSHSILLSITTHLLSAASHREPGWRVFSTLRPNREAL